MRSVQIKGLCLVAILVLFIELALSAAVDDGFLTPICKSEPISPFIRRQWNWERLDNDDLTSTIGSTQGCPNTRQIAYVGVVADCTYAAGFNSTDSAREYIHDIVNTASVVYENTFNIALQLRNLTISDPECPSGGSSDENWNQPCSSGDLGWRLRQFSSWRDSFSDDVNAYWTLLTGCGDGGEVGISWIGELCSSGSQYGSSGTNTNVVGRTQNEWQVFAHESAHTLGAVHDCTSTTCGSSTECCPLSSSTCDADGEYIMNPTSWSGMTRFSPCTVGAVCSKLGSGEVSTDCLIDSRSVNTPESTSTCGNGVVEPGEACDCGQNACSDEDARCCDSLTCQWRAGNQCTGGGSGGGTNNGNGDSSDDDGFGNSSWWSEHHREVIIGVAVGVGGLVLLIIFISTIVFWRRRRQRTVPVPKVANIG
ncbi:hypothetical protein PHISCL_06806 [Aspergillus sclerotialis]|uniref:Uncharacterized protein n=1 Tax=Aspergillus sclerotialis TaxID=2070753 RepID=A0A3A2ZCG8_9EURO|nr:hypothetical protein PHISCL_06806 [Aspergillus sclerotialis]